MSLSIEDGYEYTNKWFSPLIVPIWNCIVPMNEPSKFLEIGSFEGRSTCWTINKFARMRNIEMHCVDSWQGADDNKEMEVDFNATKERFLKNTSRAVSSNPFKTEFHIHQGDSTVELMKLFLDGKKEYFDFIYVDAGHKASECLSDMVLAWKLLKKGGIMCIDDYIFALRHRPRWDVPKTAVDAFINIHNDDCELIVAPNAQIFARKITIKYEYREL
jgi:predicted O-methyltransferase YrrM